MQVIEESLDYTVIAALVLSIIHIFGPVMRRSMRRRAELVSSFGGGIAVAYVLLSLLPEIELAHKWLGDHVHVVTLVSFVCFYAIEVRLFHHRHAGASAGGTPVSGGEPSTRVFWWHIALSWFYTWMVIFALPERSGENLAFAVGGTLAIGLHLVYKDYVLRAHYQESFEEKGRYLLASAPIVGWLATQIAAPSEVAFDVFVAVIAGILMQGVFRDELPYLGAVHLRWMIGGAATFAALSLLTI